MIALLTFGALTLTCVVFSYLVMHSLARIHSRSYFVFRLWLLPGVVVHEIAHMIGCVLTGTPVEAFSFWSQSGGHVVHHKPKYAFLQPIISLAPIPVGIFLLLFLVRQLSWQNTVVSLISLTLMVSIAGTLAPSTADFIPSLEGLFVISLSAALVFFYLPSVLSGLQPELHLLNHELQMVVIILAAIWLVIQVVYRLLRK